MEGVAAAQRIFEILETPNPSRGYGQKTPPAGLLSIEFRDVSVTYAGSSRPALTQVHFQLPAGKRTAVVGPTGAGKSTLAALLLDFISPTTGQILVNGVHLQSLRPCEWRQKVAWVPQSPYIFHGTIAENIRLARPDASMEEIVAAARQAELHDFVDSLSEGYETPVGERGARLSGGQAQRLALARAFLKDAPFLILDEPTSNLDPEIELRIQSVLERLMKGRTVLYIAHRLSTVFSADQILVLSGGRILEVGTHTELSQRGGFYAKLLAAYKGVAL
jgi:ATP-binding cassette subfamily C protein CydD